jgi:hypothetical protein
MYLFAQPGPFLPTLLSRRWGSFDAILIPTLLIG